MTEIKGAAKVRNDLTKNVKTGEEKTVDTDAVFIAVGIVPATDFVKDLVKTDEKGFIEADENTATSVSGIFAAGDIRTKRLRQVITAASDGACAVTAVTDYLTTL